MLQDNQIEGQELSESLRVLRAIRQIVTDDLLPSDGRLPTERRLAMDLGASRRSVRYALDQLEAEGLVWRKQGKGTFVGQPPDPTEELAAKIVSEVDPLTAMEARLCIEPALADLCARRATADDVALLRQLADRTHEAGEAEAAELWDGALHRAIARIAGNRVMLTAFTLIDEVRMGEEWRRKRHRARTPETRAAYDDQHSRIIDAINARDGAAAAEAMRDHLNVLFSNLKTSLEKERR
ncbi:FadR/GntR family transcriptional regulator [Marimonas arenosa]|uniref:FCD domain-containing protein n=1 Tax=Marimonas arenosa TaxID=1795305 RepID=A0AAE3WG63_9RHOB|nr:FCD domain-containing protein [Marimonas arenosa]MDQ2092411.1 FCD domain-containing protein [Marimonas arenosa]